MKIVSFSQAKEGSSGPSGFVHKFSRVHLELRQDPYRVGLLPAELIQQVFEIPPQSAAEFWIALDDLGKTVGRLSANFSPVYPGVGYIGFFEAADLSTTKALLNSAWDWFRNKSNGSALKIYGPVNFNTWLPYRFRVGQEEDPTPSFSFEPVNPPEYPLWFQELGFRPVETYHSSASAGVDGIVESTKKSYEKALQNGFSFRQMAADGFLERAVPKIHEISQVVFQDNFLFEPIPYSFFHSLYVPIAKKADLSLSYFALDPQGKEVGFFFNFIESGSFVMKTAALLPESRGAGVSNAMLYLAAKDAQTRGVRQSIVALVRDGIQSESYTRKQVETWKHRYALFLKEFS